MLIDSVGSAAVSAGALGTSVLAGEAGPALGCPGPLRLLSTPPRRESAYDAAMIRPVLTELALFVAPFAVYAIVLWATRAGVLDRVNWPLARIAWLLMAALVLMIGSFVVLAHWQGAPPGATYVPAHIEDGKFVPGETK